MSGVCCICLPDRYKELFRKITIRPNSRGSKHNHDGGAPNNNLPNVSNKKPLRFSRRACIKRYENAV